MLEIYNFDVLIFLQDELPNDRKIGKLVEYAVKNPLRIPKVRYIGLMLSLSGQVFSIEQVWI